MEPNNKQFKDSGERNALKGANGSLVRSGSTADPMGDFVGKLEENTREYTTRRSARDNDTVELLEDLSKAGIHTEVSGDALARLKAGKPAKYHREI